MLLLSAVSVSHLCSVKVLRERVMGIPCTSVWKEKNRSGLVKRTMNREKEMERGWRGQAVGEPHQGLISLTLGWNSWSDTGFLSAIVHLDSAAKVDPVNQQLSVKYIFNGSNF